MKYGSKHNRGLISVFVLAMLSFLVTGGLALVEMQIASTQDASQAQAASKARLLAQSAMQEAKYFTMKVNHSWTGNSGEQVVPKEGTFEYVTSKSGTVYSVIASGYVPSKNAPKKTHFSFASQFTYNSIPIGVVVLDTSSASALSMSGNGVLDIDSPTGRVVVNSNSKTAFVGSGNSKLESPEIDIVGNYSLSGNAKMVGNVQTNYPPAQDPLAFLVEPDSSALAVQKNSKYSVSSGTVTINPGVYKGGIAISNNAVVTFNSGVYYVQGGGFTVSGNAKITGDEVMIFNAPNSGSDVVSINGNGQVHLSPPKSGDYSDILLFQKRGTTAAASITGNGNTAMGGAIYFPNAKLTITGNGSGNMIGNVHVVKSLAISGNGSVTITDDN